MKIVNAKVEELLITQPFGQLPISAEKTEFLLEGMKYDRHFGGTRLSDVRTRKLLQKGVETRNLRQVTIVSSEEIKSISKKMGVTLTSADMEANIVLSGVKDLTKLPIGTFIKFPRQAILYVTGENFPCVVVSNHMINRGEERLKSLFFPKHAMGFRGLTALVFASGFAKVGDEVEIYLPGNLE